jgi:hypothetical protein
VTAKREMTYRRPAHVEGGAAFLYYLSAEIRADSRVSPLTPAQRWALLVAVEQHADGAGVFYLSLRTWAGETGVSRRTLQYMIASCEVSGLLGVSVFSIGTGGPVGPTGARLSRRSNTYAVDSVLVDRARTRGADSANHKGRKHRRVTRGADSAQLNVSNVLNNARTPLRADAEARPRRVVSPAEALERGPGR